MCTGQKLAPEEIKEIGYKLQTLRNAAGYTQQTVAKALGMKFAHLSRVERGERGISLKALCRAADFFGVPRGYLVPGEPLKQSVLDEAIMHGVVEALSPDVRRWAEEHDILSWLLLGYEASQKGLTPSQLRHFVAAIEQVKRESEEESASTRRG